MEEYITRAEHKEFSERLDAENKRQNRRIDDLGTAVKQIGELTISVQKLAMSVESMVKEQGRQGEQIRSTGKPGRRNVEKSNWICDYHSAGYCHWICAQADWYVNDSKRLQGAISAFWCVGEEMLA